MRKLNEYGNVMPYRKKISNVEQKINTWDKIENSNNDFKFNPNFKE